MGSERYFTLLVIWGQGKRWVRNVQDGHEHGEPELLGGDERVRIDAPLAGLEVVGVAEHDEDPGCLMFFVSLLFFTLLFVFSRGGKLTASPNQPINRWWPSNTLWWLFRTQGNALRIEIITSTLVMIPVAMTAAWVEARWIRMSTTL